MPWQEIGELTLNWEWQSVDTAIFGIRHNLRLTQIYTQPHPGRVLFSLRNYNGEFLKIYNFYPLPPARIITVEIPEELVSFLVLHPVARLSPWSRVYQMNDWKLKIEEYFP